MQQEQLAKLKALISTSLILSPSEKSEWLALLELMNDKQLGELEKILRSGIRNEELGIREQKPKIPNEKFQISNAPQNPAPVQGQMPKLSHILNMPTRADAPKVEPVKAVKNLGEAKPPSSQQLNSDLVNKLKALSKPSNTFGQKLKSMLAEKEITAPPQQADLPPKTVQAPVETRPKPLVKPPVLPPPSVPSPKPKIVLPPIVIAVQLPEEKVLSAQPKPMTVQLPEIKVLPPQPKPPVAENYPPEPASLPEPAPLEVRPPVVIAVQLPEKKVLPPQQKPMTVQLPEKKVLPPQPKPPVAENYIPEPAPLPEPLPLKVQAPSVIEIEPLPQPVQRKNLSSDSGFVPGINFVETSESAKQKNLASIREHISESEPVAIKGPTLPVKGLDTLQDLPKLSAKILQENDYNSLLKKIKSLVGTYGYHDAIFNIEKSQLYKDYIKTGMEVLDKASGFEQLGEGYLPRQQFEKFVDLLRQIQVG